LNKHHPSKLDFAELMKTDFDFSKIKIGLIISNFNKEISEKLKKEVIKELNRHKIKTNDSDYLIQVSVPGVFEIPQTAYHLVKTNELDVIICLGSVIKGETKHDEYISMAVSNGITQVSILTDTPIIFGVLTTQNMKQAEERISNGSYYAKTALAMAIINTS